MKKTINLLLVLIGVFALASCSMFQKEDVATQKDLVDFLKEKDLYKITKSEYDYEVAEGVYKYEFTFKSYGKNKDQKGTLSKKIDVKGRAVLDIQEDTSYFEYYLKGKSTLVQKVPTISGKLSNESTIKEETYMMFTSENNRLYYIGQETKTKSTYGSSKTDKKIKTSSNRSELSEYVPNFKGILSDLVSDDAYVFLDDKKCTIISSDFSEKRTVEMWFDGDGITKLKVTFEYHDGKDVAVLKFKDVDSIEKPKNSSDYKDIDKTEE